MARYGIGRLTTNVTTAQVAMDIASPTGVRFMVYEWAWTLQTAVASVFGLNRPTTLGTRTGPVAIVGFHDGDPALVGITLVDTAIAHSAQPAFAAVDHKLFGVPATIGAGRVWRFDNGFRIAVSLSAALVSRGATGTVNTEVEGEV